MEFLKALAGVAPRGPAASKSGAVYAFENGRASVTGAPKRAAGDAGSSAPKRSAVDHAVSVICSRDSSDADLRVAQGALVPFERASRAAGLQNATLHAREGGQLAALLGRTLAVPLHQPGDAPSVYADAYAQGSGVYNEPMRNGFLAAGARRCVLGLVKWIDDHAESLDDCTLFRGVGLWSNIALDGELADPAFMSKSTSIERARSFMKGSHKCLLILHYPGRSRQLMFNALETEVLTYPGERFAVVDVGLLSEAYSDAIYRVQYAVYAGNLYGTPLSPDALDARMRGDAGLDAVIARLHRGNGPLADTPDPACDDLYVATGDSITFLWFSPDRPEKTAVPFVLHIPLTHDTTGARVGTATFTAPLSADELYGTRYEHYLMTGFCNELFCLRGFGRVLRAINHAYEGLGPAYTAKDYNDYLPFDENVTFNRFLEDSAVPTGVHYKFQDAAGLLVSRPLTMRTTDRLEFARVVLLQGARVSLDGVPIERELLYRRPSVVHASEQ
jgi:hypothetical protein